MRSCIFIMGTNCTGKSTLAREIIKREGNISRVSKLCTYTNNGRVAFGGSYASESSCGVGVDRLGKTSCLIDAICEAEKFGFDTFVAEGCIIGTFGMNITNALLLADNPTIVFLHANPETIKRRLYERSGSKLTRKIMDKQKSIINAVLKYKEIGVRVLAFNDKIRIEKIADHVKERLIELNKK